MRHGQQLLPSMQGLGQLFKTSRPQQLAETGCDLSQDTCLSVLAERYSRDGKMSYIMVGELYISTRR